jgi:hypothetical protein
VFGYIIDSPYFVHDRTASKVEGVVFFSSWSDIYCLLLFIIILQAALKTHSLEKRQMVESGRHQKKELYIIPTHRNHLSISSQTTALTVKHTTNYKLIGDLTTTIITEAT